MAEVASAYVSIMPSAKGFGKQLDSQIGGDVDASGKKAGTRWGAALKTGAMAGIAGLGIVATKLLGDSVTAASEAQQAVGGVESVFGKYADAVLRDSKRAAQGLGLSAAAYNELITVSGAMLKNKGLTDFADRSRDLIKVGADLSAMFGGTTKDAVDALNAAMRGESDPIERYGISLNETAVKAELAANGQDKLTGAALEAAKTQARLALITRQSADAQGAFGREANTLAGQQQRLGAQFDNLKVTLGTQLLPALTSVASYVNSTALPAFAQFGAKVSAVAGFVNQHKVALTALATAIAAVVAITKIHTAVMAVQAAGGLLAVLKATKIVTAATKAYAAIQWLLNAALTANPIGIVIVALAALGAGLVIAYKKSETFRKIVNAAFSVVKAVASQVASFFTTKIPAAFARVQSAASSALGWIKGNWPAIVAVLTGPFGIAALLIAKNWDKIKAGGEAVVNFIKTIPGKIIAVFTGAAASFYNAGSQLMSMLAKGITDKIGDAIAAAQAGLSRLKGLLPGSPIKWGPLKNWNNGGAGKRLMELVAKGITAATPKTVKAAKTAFDKIADQLTSTRDSLKGKLESLKGDFASLASSVSGAFTGGLFDVSASDTGTVGQNFVSNLMGKKAELTSLLASFKTLQGWGIPSAFLSQLFASGNGALITELAGMGQAGAVSTASLFGEVTSLGTQLGNAVASNDVVASKVDETNRLLGIAVTQLEFLDKNIGKQLNGAAASAQRDRKNRGKK